MVQRSCKYNQTRAEDLIGDALVTLHHEVYYPRRTAPPGPRGVSDELAPVYAKLQSIGRYHEKSHAPAHVDEHFRGSLRGCFRSCTNLGM